MVLGLVRDEAGLFEKSSLARKRLPCSSLAPTGGTSADSMLSYANSLDEIMEQTEVDLGSVLEAIASLSLDRDDAHSMSPPFED